MGYARKGKRNDPSPDHSSTYIRTYGSFNVQFQQRQHSPLACPYKTENRTLKRQPEQAIRISRPLVLYEAGGLFVYAGRCQPALTPVLKTVGSSNAVGIDTSVRRHME